MKIVLDAAFKGLFNKDIPPKPIGSTQNPRDMAAIKRVLFLADQMDADGGAQDGDADFVAKQRVLFVEQRMEVELRAEAEADDPPIPEGDPYEEALKQILSIDNLEAAKALAAAALG